MSLGDGALLNYYKTIHAMTQEIARYSISEVEAMYPYEIEIYALLIKEQRDREEHARLEQQMAQQG